MKKFAITAALLALTAAPAFTQETPPAVKMTIDFASEEGTLTVTLDSKAGTYSASTGASGTYTYDEAAKKLCSTSGDLPGCVTFDEAKQEVGFSTGYKTDDGQTGTATVTKLEPQ